MQNCDNYWFHLYLSTLSFLTTAGKGDFSRNPGDFGFCPIPVTPGSESGVFFRVPGGENFAHIPEN